MRQARGMTLLELMVAVAILGVVTALSVVGYQAMIEQRRGRDTANAVYGATMKARQLARTTGQATRVVVARDAQNLRFVRWERPACEAVGFEPTCPVEACADAVCGQGACTLERCDALGEAIPVPEGFDLGALEAGGLCFLGGSGQPRGLACAGEVAVTELRLWPHGAPHDTVISLEPLTGQPRLRSLPHEQAHP